MLQRQIISKLQKISHSWVRQTDQALQERLGIGLSQLKIMDLLQNDVVLSQRQIADELSQTEASISRQVRLMQERGWLTTATDPSERRKRLAQSTLAGQKITIAAQEIINEQNQKLLQNISPKQQQAFLDLLQKLEIS